MGAAVLILEDDRVVADRLTRELESAGYDVIGPASTAVDALRIAKDKLPDLALLDVRIGDADEGGEVGAALGRDYGIPIVYLTAYAEDFFLGKSGNASRYAAAAVLSKPFRRQELLATIKALLSDPVRKDMQHIFFHGEYVIVCVDPQGVIQNANPAVKQALGYTAEEVIGMSMTELVHPRDLARVGEFITEAATHPGETQRIEHRVVTKSGQTRWLAWSAYVDKKTGVIYGIGSDVTARREQERRQREFSQAFRNIGASVLVADADYRITFVNETWTRQVGYAAEDIIGRVLWDLMSELGVPDGDVEGLKSSLDSGEHWRGYFKIQGANGNPLWRQIVTSPIKDPIDSEAYYVSVSADVTEVVKAREELEVAREETRRASERKSRFIAALAHDMRTPLNVVLGYADLLASEETDTEKLDRIGRIRNSARFQLDLLRDAGNLSQFEAGRIAPSRSDLSVRGLLEATTALFQPIAEERGVELDCNTSARTPRYLMLDDSLLKQALMNLLSNAFKFTDSGSVEVYADWSEGMLELSVSDSGPGIPAEAKERVFEAFEQTEHERGGSGLGLSIVREIVHALDGTVEVESTEGVGTVFYLRIPCEQAGIQSCGEPEARGEEPWGDTEQRIDTWRENVEANGLPPEIIDEAISVLISRAEDIRTARERKDADALHHVIHDVKGMAANVSMDDVRRVAHHILTLLRATPADESAAFAEARKLEELGSQLGNRVAAPAETADRWPGSTSSILLAEDNRANRELFRAYLRRCGVEPEIAEDGAEALEKLQSKDFALAILDVEMPQVSGIEVAKRIRDSRPRKSTRLVAVTGHSYPKSAPELQDFDAYLVKPVGERDLRLIVEPYCK